LFAVSQEKNRNRDDYHARQVCEVDETEADPRLTLRDDFKTWTTGQMFADVERTAQNTGHRRDDE
jgi:hypothetical protein